MGSAPLSDRVDLGTRDRLGPVSLMQATNPSPGLAESQQAQIRALPPSRRRSSSSKSGAERMNSTKLGSPRLSRW